MMFSTAETAKNTNGVTVLPMLRSTELKKL